MGMAASQARLLSITARLSDNELRSQTINNAKMRLATQSSQASENYISALNNANLMFSNYDDTGAEKSQLLTFNALTAYSSYNNQYGLVNSSGQLFVSEGEAKMFDAANGNLNAYLKSHGLEFTTTYFDTVGNIENPEYPVPFKVIEPDTLKEMYEASGSYENSVEVDKYEKYYKEFISATNTLKAGTKEIMQSYLLYNGNSPRLKIVDPKNYPGYNLIHSETGFIIDISGNAQQLATAFKNAFLSSSNTYGINYLKNMGLTTEGYNELSTLINGVGYESSGVGIIKQECSSSYVKNPDGSESLSVMFDGDEIIASKDKNGVISLTLPASSTDPDDTYTWTGTASTSLLATINSVMYSDDDDNINFNAKYDTNGDIIVESVVRYPNKAGVSFGTALNDLAESMYDMITTDDSFFDFGVFADKMLEWQEKGVNLSGKGIDINKVLKSNKTYDQVLQEYKQAKDNYFGFIETNYEPSVLIDSALETAVKNGEITIKEMADMDKVLKILNKHNIAYTNDYKTVISEYIIDMMIADKGEPKYAWVDENDKNNTDNADAKAQWYTNMFNRMKQGYKVLENGLASSSKWIEYAMESGIVTMEQVDKSFNWKSLDYKTCTRITEQTDNSDLVAKAEAEYNRAMKDIDAKDSIYDIELKNIDTEHTSLQTEYESIKSVISKNIDRTFKFNQNG